LAPQWAMRYGTGQDMYQIKIRIEYAIHESTKVKLQYIWYCTVCQSNTFMLLYNPVLILVLNSLQTDK
jgi:hypothetical protein